MGLLMGRPMGRVVGLVRGLVQGIALGLGRDLVRGCALSCVVSGFGSCVEVFSSLMRSVLFSLAGLLFCGGPVTPECS